MAKSVFLDKTDEPATELINARLGSTTSLWVELVEYIKREYPDYETAWKFYGKAFGWAFVFRNKKKTLVYLTPNENIFFVSLSMSPRGREEVLVSGLPDELKKAVQDSVNNSAGRTCDYAVKSEDELENVKILLELRHRF